jgi:hypothetical protein
MDWFVVASKADKDAKAKYLPEKTLYYLIPTSIEDHSRIEWISLTAPK